MEKQLPKPIRKLDQVVVNRIAAGEIIQRPSNALKELIENSLDAGATSITILVKEGGLKLLQIQDNGHGIRKEDLPIVCERFTTSKLQTFDDLQTISTYGFRGEALASISHVAHLTITTKTTDSSCAWRAMYADGKLFSAIPGSSHEPKACAGNDGTLISVEDLFFNVPTRRKAFKNVSEEYNRIVDVVNRYAIHNAGYAFVCKKYGMNNADVNTQMMASKLDNIRAIYGPQVAKELVEFETTNEKLDMKANGYFSNANYNMKKITFLLFINHRAVEHSGLRKSIESLYSAYLPRGTHPFIYLALELKPQNVDVNVHPTKREVAFLNEEEIVESICDAMQSQLASVNTSRTFSVQTLLPMTKNSQPFSASKETALESNTQVSQPSFKPKPIYAYNMNRTDTQTRTLDSMITISQKPPRKRQAGEETEVISEKLILNDSMSQNELMMESRPRTTIDLLSIKELREEVIQKKHNATTDILARHVFVGIADEDSCAALIQHETSLYLVNYGIIAESFFYQIGLCEFGNFGRINLSPPADIYELVMLAIQEDENLLAQEDAERDAIARNIVEVLIEKGEMLDEYFSMGITEEGKLTSLPMMLKDYEPNLDKLPSFLSTLGPNVNWEEEKSCFESFLRELAYFYAPLAPMKIPEDDNDAYEEELNSYRRQIEHVLFPAIKGYFVGTVDLIQQEKQLSVEKTSKETRSGYTNGAAIVQVTSLQRLYKVFERC